jgi:hypothetical protein
MSVPIDRIREVIAELEVRREDAYAFVDPDSPSPVSDYNEGLHNAYELAAEILQKVVKEHEASNTRQPTDHERDRRTE